MKRIILALVLGAWATNGMAEDPTNMPANATMRICDGIGWQYKCISSSVANKHGFGGVGDTLTSDSTVSRGTLMNIKRCKEGGDNALAELLPIFTATRTQLDSSYLFTKWSAPVWGLNNFYSSVGGLNGYIVSKSDSGRASPYFARVARANGVYLGAKTVFPPGMNLGSIYFSGDSTYVYSDSSNVDSTLYGPFYTPLVAGVANTKVEAEIAGLYYGTNRCSLVIYGCNQSLVHGRTWRTYINDGGENDGKIFAAVSGDSLYGIDSIKCRAFTDPDSLHGSWVITGYVDRFDSL